MGREEQIEEREVLGSIFPDEITDVSETEYIISIKLDVNPVHGETELEEPIINLHVTYPPTYPDVPPSLALSSPPGSSTTSNNAHLSLPADTPDLLSHLSDSITENLGMAMIFTLVTTLKDRAEQLIAERLAQVQAARDDAARRREEIENRRFAGERVTPDAFWRWRDRFRREMAEKEDQRRADADRESHGGGGGKGAGMTVAGTTAATSSAAGAGAGAGGKKEERKLTGRELWEKGLVGKSDADVDPDPDEELAMESTTAAAAAALGRDVEGLKI